MQQISGSGGVVDWLFGKAIDATFGSIFDTTLRSRAYLNVLYLLSEGEIAGFEPGQDIRKYIYADNTPIIAANGTPNFRGVSAEWRSGTQFQDIIAGTRQGTGAPVNVGVKVTKRDGAIIRTVSSAVLTDLRVTLFTPAIVRVDGDGSSRSSEVDFKIYLSTNGGPFVEKVYDKFRGKTSGGYARDYTFHVDGNVGPWRIKVERTNDDVAITNTKEQNDLFWQSYTTLVEDKFRYPNSSLLFVRLDAAYFRAQPTLTIKLNGIICRVPSNYNPVTRIYTGVWNGTFMRAFTNNPAWCLLEMLTNKRFGTGNYMDITQIDKWSFYRMAVYCDEPCDDGQGGFEPRFRYDDYLKDKQDAFTVINNILAQIRAIAFYAGGQIMVSQDRPGLVSEDIFNESNVVHSYDESGKLTSPPFIYDYVSLKEKHSKSYVNWFDPNEFGKKKTAYTDLFDIGYGADFYRYGDEVKEVSLSGCTSGAEAKRHGKWLLATERLESKTISFATGSQGLLRVPGSLIRVCDKHRQQKRLSGRIVAATNNSVTLDAEVTLAVGISYNLLTIVEGVELSLVVLNPAGTYTTLSVNLASLPAPNSPWVLGNATSEIYRLAAVSDAKDGVYGLIGILHSPIKAVIADNVGILNVALTNRGQTLPPTDVTVSPSLDGYFIGWNASVSTNVVQYELEWQEEGTNRWTPVPIGAGITDADVILPTGTYKWRVAALALFGGRSEWVYSTVVYATSGKVVFHNQDGSIKLSQYVNLLPGVDYYLDTYCGNPAGPRPNNLQSPYRDRRLVLSVGVTDTVTVSPSYLGDRATYLPGSYADINPKNISYLEVTGTTAASFVTVYQEVNFSGYRQVLTPGIYRADAGQLNTVGNDGISSIKVELDTIVNVAQHEPGTNPISSSQWSLGTVGITGNPGGA